MVRKIKNLFLRRLNLILPILLLISAGVLIAIASNPGHSSSQILVKVDGYTMTLQEAINNDFLVQGEASPSGNLTAVLAGAYHTADSVYVSVGGADKTLQQAIDSTLCSSVSSSYTSAVSLGHTSDKIDLSFEGAEADLQSLINSKNLCGCSEICGNNIIESTVYCSEQCDNSNLSGQTCQSLLGASYILGSPTCTSLCSFNTANCCTDWSCGACSFVNGRAQQTCTKYCDGVQQSEIRSCPTICRATGGYSNYGPTVPIPSVLDHYCFVFGPGYESGCRNSVGSWWYSRDGFGCGCSGITASNSGITSSTGCADYCGSLGYRCWQRWGWEGYAGCNCGTGEVGCSTGIPGTIHAGECVTDCTNYNIDCTERCGTIRGCGDKTFNCGDCTEQDYFCNNFGVCMYDPPDD